MKVCRIHRTPKNAHRDFIPRWTTHNLFDSGSSSHCSNRGEDFNKKEKKLLCQISYFDVLVIEAVVVVDRRKISKLIQVPGNLSELHLLRWSWFRRIEAVRDSQET
jgi:hypothetical protein